MEKMLPIEADLTLLRSEMPAKRRQSRRFRCNLATMAKFRLPNETEAKIAWAYNLSQAGVGLNSPQPLDEGQEIVINFRLDGKELGVMAAKVIFCRVEIDESWRIGCEFLKPISQEDLDILLS